MPVLVGTKKRNSAKTSLPVAAAWLAAAAALALAGCNRAERTSSPASQTVQAAPAPTATPAGYVYITNNGEGTVSELGRQADGTLNFLRTAKAGAVNGPTGIAIDPSNRFLYVANEGDDRVYQFRIKRDTGDLSTIGEGAVDAGPASHPQQIAISPRGDFAYVTNSGKDSDGKDSDGKDSDGSIAEYAIDSTTGALKPLEIFRGSGLQSPLGIAFMPNGKFVYVSDSGAGTLVAFAVEPSGKLKLVASTPSLGDKPGHPGLIAVHPSSAFVYSVDRLLGTVVVAKPAEDGKLSVTNTYHVGISTSGPFGVALAAVGPKMFVYTGNRGSDTVSTLEVKPGGLEIVGECPTGMGYPTGMVTDSSGHLLYVVDRDASTVTQFALADSDGIAIFPTAAVFTGLEPSEASHPLYIAMTRWDAPSSVAQAQEQRTK